MKAALSRYKPASGGKYFCTSARRSNHFHRPETGDYVVTHKGINFINFTGSTEVGQHISKISGMVPLLLELGGKDAAIVLEDADLDFAAKNIVSGAYSYSGQRCTAVKRILVQESVADKLVGKIKPLVEKLTIGNPMDEVVSF